MYGTKRASTLWEETYSRSQLRLGFIQGIAAPCCFNHSTHDLQFVVHGDDFIVLGCDTDPDSFQKAIQGEFEVNIRGRLGSGSKDASP